jgi:hypothetical protein
MKFEISVQVLEKYSNILYIMKISPVAAELFHAKGRTGGETDMTKLLLTLCSNDRAYLLSK